MENVEQVIRGLMTCLMKAALYFPGHSKVREAAIALLEPTRAAAETDRRLVIGIRERQIIYAGRPLYDMSLYAVRLIDAIRSVHAYGLSFDPAVTEEEVMSLVAFLTEKSGGFDGLEQAQAALKVRGVTHISLERMPAEISAGEALVLAAPDATRVYQDSMSLLQDVVISTRGGTAVDTLRVAGFAQNIADCIRQRRDELLSLTTFREYDEYTYNHSVNVCILTVALASSFVRDRDMLVRIGEAALLHDVGKSFISDEVLYKPGKLTDEEYEMVKTHPQRGASFLATMEGVHDLSISVAFGHHLGHDQKGYPKLEEKIHVDTVTLMVNIADVYEALTSKRPYKRSLSPDKAAAVLVEGAGTQFSPGLVRAFVRVLGLYPPGTRVRLARGDTGVVQSVNQDFLDRPRVVVVQDREGKQVSEPYVVDTAQVNEKGEYIHQIKEVLQVEE